MKTRLLVKHKKDCWAVKSVKNGTWRTSWSGIVEQSTSRAKDGSNRGTGYFWHHIPCNCPNCPGVLLVKFDEDLPK